MVVTYGAILGMAGIIRIRIGIIPIITDIMDITTHGIIIMDGLRPTIVILPITRIIRVIGTITIIGTIIHTKQIIAKTTDVQRAHPIIATMDELQTHNIVREITEVRQAVQLWTTEGQ